MKYIFLILVFFLNANALTNDFIKNFSYEDNFHQAMNNAKKLDKKIMMVLTTKSCAWCMKFENQTLKKENIDKLIKENFVPLTLDNDIKDFPTKYKTEVVPTIFFIRNDGKVIDTVYGYKNKKDFEKLLKEVVKK